MSRNPTLEEQAAALDQFWGTDSSRDAEPREFAWDEEEYVPDNQEAWGEPYGEPREFLWDEELDEDDDEPDELDVEEFFARMNPLGLPLWALGLGAGAGGWILWRLQQRRRLVSLLKSDPRTSGYPSPEGIASELITFTNFKTANQAFEEFAHDPAGMLTQLLSVLPEQLSQPIADIRTGLATAESSGRKTYNTGQEGFWSFLGWK